MPSTSGFEVVAELSVDVLRQALRGAWDNSVVPHSVPIAAGLPFGPYRVAQGTVNIPRNQLDLDLVPASNRVRVILGTNVQVEVADPPVPSARFFDLATLTQLDLPVGTLPNTVNVGILLSQVTRGDVAVSITSGDPVAPLTLGLIAEYLHARYLDGTIPHSQTLTGANLGGITADAYLELFDDAGDPARRISVSAGGAPNTVKIVLPVRLRLSNVSNAAVRAPLAVVAGIAVTVPLVVVPGSVSADLSGAAVAIENLAPAPGSEGANYSLDVAGYPPLAGMLAGQLQSRGQAVVNAIGSITVAVPTVATIGAFIADRTFEALRARGDIPIWTPQTAGTPVAVRDVQAKVLASSIAFGINAGGGANAGAIADFIPAGKSCAVAIDGAKVLAVIDAAIHSDGEGGFGSSFPPKTFDNIEGRRVRLNSLTPSLIDGFIQLEGNVTVFDAIAGSIDVDADFTARLTLEWVDNPNGSQSLKASLAGDPDVDLGIGTWILGLILGFLTLGAVGVVIVAIVLSIADDLAETVGGNVVRDQVTGRVQTLTAWPPALQGIGDVVSRFENPVTIDPQGIMFPDAYEVHATFETTADALAQANGPYAVDAGSPIQFVGGPARPDTDYEWDFGDGSTAAQMSPVHAYGDDGVYVARLTTRVNQPGGVVTRHFAAIRARNVAPVVDAGNAITIDEGQEVDFVASFTDEEWLDTHEATFFFGDDSPPLPGAVAETNVPPRARGTTHARHAYCDNGEYILTVEVRDDDGGVGLATRTVVVRNVPPTVDAGVDLFLLPDIPVTLRACFSDPGWCDTHRGTWDPGDCSPARTAIVRERHEPPAGIGTVAATHVYERCGTYVATCVVVDDDGGEGRDSIVVRVVDVQNRDFEGGFRGRAEGTVATAWEPYGAEPGEARAGGPFVAEEFVVHGGQRAQRIAAPPGARIGLRQTLGANVGWDYQVAAWQQLPTAGAGCRARLGIDPAGGDDPDAAGITWCERGPSDAWQQLAERVTATSGAITIFAEIVAGDRGGLLYLDDVEVIPEACPLDECVAPKPSPDERRCLDLRPESPRTIEPEAEMQAFGLASLDQRPLRIVETGNPPAGALRIPAKGLQVTLPFTSRRVTAEVGSFAGGPVTMVALDQGGLPVAKTTSTADPREKLVVEANDIVWVVLLDGGNEAVLVELCADRATAGERRRGAAIERQGRASARKGR